MSLQTPRKNVASRPAQRQQTLSTFYQCNKIRGGICSNTSITDKMYQTWEYATLPHIPGSLAVSNGCKILINWSLSESAVSEPEETIKCSRHLHDIQFYGRQWALLYLKNNITSTTMSTTTIPMTLQTTSSTRRSLIKPLTITLTYRHRLIATLKWK